ncbi:unnamed protein product [Rotaria magnacalcarata]|uniref:Uncharacterized protein n=1 Tax=Rotaria magnacalcarata TaxID=392030 RepID=A0A816R162_9BILA|nr:unnamed protein product [Rotaria magnacalcarata]CAF2117732.1 unnamed protein product [Rotaria magnacalcarata]CAF3835705.1 unnamed protein product [Rotaria magnacalcarata]CAF3888027.1 unnamed protein product [Rotaria magnacalcarata]
MIPPVPVADISWEHNRFPTCAHCGQAQINQAETEKEETSSTSSSNSTNQDDLDHESKLDQEINQYDVDINEMDSPQSPTPSFSVNYGPNRIDSQTSLPALPPTYGYNNHETNRIDSQTSLPVLPPPYGYNNHRINRFDLPPLQFINNWLKSYNAAEGAAQNSYGNNFNHCERFNDLNDVIKYLKDVIKEEKEN